MSSALGGDPCPRQGITQRAKQSGSSSLHRLRLADAWLHLPDGPVHRAPSGETRAPPFTRRSGSGSIPWLPML